MVRMVGLSLVGDHRREGERRDVQSTHFSRRPRKPRLARKDVLKKIAVAGLPFVRAQSNKCNPNGAIRRAPRQ
jgi:hypothetical protein